MELTHNIAYYSPTYFTGQVKSLYDFSDLGIILFYK